MLLKLKSWIFRPLSLLKVIYCVVLFFLLLEIEPLFVYVSLSIVLLSRIIQIFPRFLSNLFLLALTGYLAVYFQFELHPESALSFFIILTAFKFIQVDEQRDFHFVLHCLFIVVGGGALFNRTLYYISFAMGSLVLLFFFFQIPDFKKSDGINRENLINILKIMLLASPLIVSLFIFFPRYRYFFPSLGSQKTGKIGYSQSIDNNSIASLRLNGVPALRVYSKTEIPSKDLYWRGRVFSKTLDGYNWKHQRFLVKQEAVENSLPANFEGTYLPLENFNGDLIVKDWPLAVESSAFRINFDQGNQTFGTYFKNNKKQYKAFSSMVPIGNIDKENFLSVPQISLNQKNIFPLLPNHQGLEELISHFRQWLMGEGFVYSLSPGKMDSMKAFIENKKGYCTHYAALLALYLRLHEIPSRIISGFQGGEYNTMGQYYLIRSNDAHAWVEAWVDGSWKRLDPTAWVAPERILIGGQRYLAPYPFAEGLRSFLGIDLKKSSLLVNYYDFQKYIDYLNSRVNLFFTNFNLEAQKVLAEKLKLNLKTFFSFALILPVILIALFFIFLNFDFRKIDKKEKLLRNFEKKLKQYGLSWQRHESSSDLLLKVENHPKSSEIKKILSDYSRVLYSKQSSEVKFKRVWALIKQL